MDYEVVYVLGSPRSGTTILGDTLDRHDDVRLWMEPYFIYDFHCGYGADDVRTAAHASAAAVTMIRREADRLMRRCGKRVLVVKLLANSFRLPFIREVHPQARFIHLVRDGRDVALSLRNRQRYRAQTIRRRSLPRLLREAASIIGYHDLHHLLLLARFELRTRERWSIDSLFNKSKWEGRPYFGARPPGWRELFAGRSDLEIAALQWVALEQHLDAGLSDVEPASVCELRYETLSRDPAAEMARVLAFLGVDALPAGDIVHDMRADNTDKWRVALSAQERETVSEIMDATLTRLGYAATPGRSES